MSIQVTLSANQFNHTGSHNDRPFTSLIVNRTSNSRVYFTTVNNGMRMSEMAKQMQLIDGQVVISFGKNDKLIIGTYVDTNALEVIEEVVTESDSQETSEQTPSNKENKTLINTFTTNQYTISLFSSPDYFDHKYVYFGQTVLKYHLTFTELNTGIINHELSDTVYLSLGAAMNEVNKHTSIQSNHTIQQAQTNSDIKSKQINKQIDESFPQVDMVASHANMTLNKDTVNILFTNQSQSNTVTFKLRKSWSHRKYIDLALEKTGIKPSWEFNYRWEII